MYTLLKVCINRKNYKIKILYKYNEIKKETKTN